MAKHTLRGKVLSHNVSPKGHIEGYLLDTAKGTVQINLPKHGGAAPAVGTKHELTGELEDDEYDHPVYRAADAEGEVTGEITRLNYALHGEVNGFILDDDTFVHLKPEGAKKAKLKLGDRIVAKGHMKTGEVRVLETTRVAKA